MDDIVSFSRVVVLGRFSFSRDRIVEINGNSVSFSIERCVDVCYFSGDRCVDGLCNCCCCHSLMRWFF